jgi:predicted DCC family thiol-disulfide oxidoreductase YuxK
VQARDRAGRVLAIPSQAPGVRSSFGLTRSQTDREAWAIEPGGRYAAGAAAINRVLTALGGGWATLAALYRVPLIRSLEDCGYGWIARHRHYFAWLGVTPACDQPGASCEGSAS